MKDYLQTVTGPVAREDMGLTLPHEHLFNDLSSVVDAPCYPFSQRLVDKKVTAEIQWALKHDPYCCADNMDRKPIEDVIFEINNFISLGGRTIVDATGSESIGRDAQALREVALKTGLNIVASSGPYLEKFESQRIHKTVDELATTIDKELNQGIGDTDIRAGMIGEIGVSPTFTEGRPAYHRTSGTGTGPGGYPGAGPSDSRWQPGFLLCRTWSALTLHNHITPVFTFIFCLQRYPIMKIITRGEAMRIHQQHPTSRLFPFCTGKYRWHGSAEAYTGREVQDIPGVLAVFAERRKDSFGPYVRLMSVTLN